MSYIEKKNLEKIKLIFGDLKDIELQLIKLLKAHSYQVIDDIAKSSAELNSKINKILKLYPEIKNMDDKIFIKSHLQFYYDLLHKFSDMIRHIENFHKLHDDYYDSIIDFIEDKKNIIEEKYKPIAKQELIAFYDTDTRNLLEKILSDKIKHGEREFFTFGSMEQEIKKISRIAGADLVSIKSAESFKNSNLFNPYEVLNSARSVINFALFFENISEKSNSKEINEFKEKKIEIINRIIEDMKKFLNPKGYKVEIPCKLKEIEIKSLEKDKQLLKKLDLYRTYLHDGRKIKEKDNFITFSIITDAELFSDS
ncbi:MAG: hypothetical protein ACTSQP_03565 [Promethearchaeota archaeon]